MRSFASGETALTHLLSGSSEDVVLLDWKMPGMNGIEVLRHLREAKLDVPVIFLTVLGDQIYEEAALQGGAVDFVEKSRSFSILLRRINLILEGVKRGRSTDTTAPLPAGSVFQRGDLELRRRIERYLLAFDLAVAQGWSDEIEGADDLLSLLDD